MFKLEVSVYNIQFHNLRVEARKVNTFRRFQTSLELSQQERTGGGMIVNRKSDLTFSAVKRI